MIIGIIFTIVGMCIGIGLSIKFIVKPTIDELKNTRLESEKYSELFLLMNEWVYIKQQGKDFKDYFKNHSYKKIAIYGMSHVGKLLLSELRGTDIVVTSGMDKNISGNYEGLPIVSPDNFSDNVDMIVVTPVFYFDNIAEMLSKKINCPIISIETIINEMVDLGENYW